MNFHDIHFVKSLKSLSDRPQPLLSEIAFVGRSNVGKSSMLNALFNRSNLAKTSSTPGKTRLINYFLLENNVYIVDLPGYGYIKVIDNDSKNWEKMIEVYLTKNDLLKMVFLLIDSRHDLMKLDQYMINWLDDFGIKFNIVMTKRDKLSNNKYSVNYKSLKQQFPDKKIIPFSAKTKEGREDILDIVNSYMI